jgi:hypothetical protein
MQPSDLNSDGVVDVIDLSILVSRWGSSDATADINGDGIVDALDLSVLVSNWGAVSSAYTALLVTADGTLNTGATALRNILSDEGYSVVVRALSEPEDYAGIDVVVMSYGNPGGDNGKYVHPPVGIVGVDTWRPIGMGTNLGFENNTNLVEVIDAANPLAAGVTGTFNAYVSPAYITWETNLSANPDIVVTRPSQPTQVVVFAYEAGSTMVTRYATTRHVALGYHMDGFANGISSKARAQLLAAVAWAKDSAYVAPQADPPPAAPSNLTTTAGDTQISLSWSIVADADSYSVKRSTTSGGPYTLIESGITTTNYIDTSLTNGTTYYYVVSAINAQGESPTSTQVSVTPVEGGGGQQGTALLVTNDETLTTGNQALHDILATAGFSVATSTWSDPEDYTGIDVVVISTGNPSGDTGKYLHPPVGLVAVDSWRQIGMGTNLGFQNNINEVEVVNSSHPIAAGTSGTHSAYTEPRYITWELDLSANPTIIVTRPSQPAQAVVFAYEAGETMINRYATTRHVGLGYHEQGLAVGLSNEAESQILAAVNWAKDSTYVAPPPPSAPTNLSATASDTQVSLSWNSVAGATSYTVKRSTTSGGPYSTIVSGHTTTSYTNTGLTNGTTYYYVVSATNAQGESPNSTQASATPVEGGSGGGGNLALLATSEELAMWQHRSVNGPFRVAGDFSSNSPGHWNEMNACMSLNFSSARWNGPTDIDSSGRIVRGGLANDPPGEIKRMAHDMMSAAYAALITGNNAVAQAITAEIEYQATRTNLNYGNRTLWPFNYYNDLNPLFMHAVWVKDYVLAYDITRSMGYSSSIVEQWFLNLAQLNEQIVHANLSAQLPNRKSNSYTSRGSAVTTEYFENHRLANGTLIGVPRIAFFYQNRRNNQAGLYGLVGALLNNTFYINEFKRYMREYVMFGSILGTYGGYGDHNRGSDSFPQLGLSYTMHGMESCLPAMDALARQGDTDLYDFSSTDGATTPKWATNYFKSMELVLDGVLKWVAQTWPPQYTGSGTPPSTGVAGNPYNLVASRNTADNREIINDANFLYAANYYNRADWQNIINRVGTPTGFTSAVQGVGNISGWRCDWRNRFLRSLDANPHN